ncbi:MAG: phosphatase PAP2 family protein [Bacteroidales bacterium]|nr:phosphatase PAP2 family protein [Bacteroidales bacterium]
MLYKTLKDNRLFLIPYLLLILAVIPVLLIYPKPDIHLTINKIHSPFADWFFRYATFLGDGLFLIVPVLFLLFFSLRHVVFLITAYFSTGLITQILKRLVFHQVDRPTSYFGDTTTLHLVDGVKMLGSYSFPSGHSTSAFALFLSLALISNNAAIKSLCFLVACTVAFSRIYLSQHFLIDTVAGSAIGVLGTLGFYLLYYRHERTWHAWSLQKITRHDQHA